MSASRMRGCTAVQGRPKGTANLAQVKRAEVKQPGAHHLPKDVIGHDIQNWDKFRPYLNILGRRAVGSLTLRQRLSNPNALRAVRVLPSRCVSGRDRTEEERAPTTPKRLASGCLKKARLADVILELMMPHKEMI